MIYLYIILGLAFFMLIFLISTLLTRKHNAELSIMNCDLFFKLADLEDQIKRRDNLLDYFRTELKQIDKELL